MNLGAGNRIVALGTNSLCVSTVVSVSAEHGDITVVALFTYLAVVVWLQLYVNAI